MKITVDRTLCEIHGQCEYVAPEIFHINDEGELIVEPEVSEELRAKAALAVQVCPALAITVEDD